MKRPAIAVTLLAMLAGCGNGPATTQARIPLANMPAGVVRLMFDKTTERVGIRLDLYGFLPNAAYTLHIHRGACLAPTPDALVTFEHVTADPSGDAKVDVRSISPTPSGIPKGAYVDVHASDSATSMLACTDIPRRSPTAPLALFAAPTRKPIGSVIARYRDGRTLELRVEVMGLDALSTHAVDLRSGSCASRSSSVADLGSLTANSVGTASLAKIEHVARNSHGFHVDVYAEGNTGPVALCADVRSYSTWKSP